MKRLSALRLTGDQHAALHAHLFPGDGMEAVAVALCGRRESPGASILAVHKIVNNPSADSRRHEYRITWPILIARDLIDKAARKEMAIRKIHSHPGRYDQVPDMDDASVGERFTSIHAWTDDGLPHASAVMQP